MCRKPEIDRAADHVGDDEHGHHDSRGPRRPSGSGVYAFAELPIWFLRVRYDRDAVSASRGSPAVTACRLVRSRSGEASLVKR